MNNSIRPVSALANAIFALLIIRAAWGADAIDSRSNVRMASAPFGRTPAGTAVQIYTLSNAQGMQVHITNYGGIVTSLTAPDRIGHYADVVLGYDKLSGYLQDSPYFGALIGRHGNRITKGRFTINGSEYQLATNNGPNALHGGLKGFDKVILKRGQTYRNTIIYLFSARNDEHGKENEMRILASEAGALLDSDLMSGGGSDDTAALQKALDRAADGTPVHLVIDGAALVTGLDVFGNTTIECLAGAGLYLKAGSSRAILRNAHRSRSDVMDRHITVRGCFLNGNRENQPSAVLKRPDIPYEGPSNREPDGTWLSGLQFLGVEFLTLQDLTLWNVRAFGALIGNASRIEMRNITVDHGGGPAADPALYGNTDGLHFKGPIRFLNIDSVRLRTCDDAIALNANDFETDNITTRNDFGPYVGQGPITDVTISNVHIMDATQGIRILSTAELIDRVIIENVTGTTRGGYVLNVSHWVNPRSLGNIGSLILVNVNVDRMEQDAKSKEDAQRWAKAWADEKYAELRKEANDGAWPFVSVNAHIRSLIVRNLVTKVSDTLPVIRIGPDARVQMMTAELSLDNPTRNAVPVQLDAGGRIERLHLSVDWRGNAGGMNPISSSGGSIGELFLAPDKVSAGRP